MRERVASSPWTGERKCGVLSLEGVRYRCLGCKVYGALRTTGPRRQPLHIAHPLPAGVTTPSPLSSTSSPTRPWCMTCWAAAWRTMCTSEWASHPASPHPGILSGTPPPSPLAGTKPHPACRHLPPVDRYLNSPCTPLLPPSAGTRQSLRQASPRLRRPPSTSETPCGSRWEGTANNCQCSSSVPQARPI